MADFHICVECVDCIGLTLTRLDERVAVRCCSQVEPSSLDQQAEHNLELTVSGVIMMRVALFC